MRVLEPTLEPEGLTTSRHDVGGENLDAEEFLAELRWPKGLRCPTCGETRIYSLDVAGVRRRRYKCSACRRQFSVTKGTILEGSKLSLSDWVRAVRFVCDRPAGVSVAELQQHLGISRKAAQNAFDRLRYAMLRDPLKSLLGENPSP